MQAFLLLFSVLSFLVREEVETVEASLAPFEVREEWVQGGLASLLAEGLHRCLSFIFLRSRHIGDAHIYFSGRKNGEQRRSETLVTLLTTSFSSRSQPPFSSHLWALRLRENSSFFLSVSRFLFLSVVRLFGVVLEGGKRLEAGRPYRTSGLISLSFCESARPRRDTPAKRNYSVVAAFR